MSYTYIRYEVANRIATITKQNPQQGYTMSKELVSEMFRALREARADDNVGVIVITSDGVHQGAFAVSEALLSGATTLQTREAIQVGHDLCRLIETIEKPVVGVVKTEANGGGFETLQPCDFLICADTAVFAQPEVGLGILAGWGGVQRLSRMMGWREAQKFLLLGEPIDGKKAAELGIASQSVPLEEVDTAVASLCEKLLRLPIQAFSCVKRDMHRAYTMTLPQALECEVDSLSALMTEGLFPIALGALNQGQVPEYPPYHRMYGPEYE